MTWWLWLIVAVVVWLVVGWLCAYFDFLDAKHDDESRGMQIVFGPPILVIFVIYGFCMAGYWFWMGLIRLLGRTVPSHE